MNPVDEHQAVQFFKEEPGFHRLFKAMIDKYRSLGRIGGTVVLRQLTDKEKEALSLFFRKDFSRQTSATISLAHFEQALAQTKFAGVPLKDILEAYHGEPIVPKKEAQEQFKMEKDRFFQQLLAEYRHRYGQIWLRHVIDNKAGSRSIHTAYHKDRERLERHVRGVLDALRHLPPKSEYVRLSVFANRLTGNPHAFDVNTETGQLLLHALQIILSHEDPTYNDVTHLTSLQKTELLQQFGLVRDDIHNFVTCAGLLAFRDDSDGHRDSVYQNDMSDIDGGYGRRMEPHPVWHVAYEQNTVLNVPLRELMKVTLICPAHPKMKVFIVENSGVFSALIDHFEQRVLDARESAERKEAVAGSDRLPPLICTHGQFKLATWLLIDKLANSGCSIYYSGDFDPEGLLMAQKLKQRHPDQVHLWRYQMEDYQRHAPTPAADATDVLLDSPSRLNKLESITEPALRAIAEEMKHHRKVVYQEAMIPQLIKDIERDIERKIEK